MRPSRLLLTLAAAATLVACGGDDDGAGTSNASTGETDASTGTSPTTTVTTDMTSTMTTGMTTSSTDATTESGTTEPTTADSSSGGSDSGTGGAACEPEVGDDACAMCEKMNCCDELVVCFDNPDCACFADCYDVMGFNSDEACRGECMLDANPDEWADVFGCGMKHCLGDCI